MDRELKRLITNILNESYFQDADDIAREDREAEARILYQYANPDEMRANELSNKMIDFIEDNFKDILFDIGRSGIELNSVKDEGDYYTLCYTAPNLKDFCVSILKPRKRGSSKMYQSKIINRKYNQLKRELK